MLRFAPLLIFGMICALLLSQLMNGPAEPRAEGWPVGQPLPVVLLPVWQPGQTTAPSAATPTVPMALPKGQAYVVNLFASWCAPCRAELPKLAQLRTKHGIPIIGVAWKDSAANLTKLLGQSPTSYSQVLMDEQGKAMTAMGATGVPESFVVGRDGRVLRRFRSNLTDADIAAIVAALSPAQGAK